MQFQRRWGQNPLHLLLDATGLPSPFRHPQRSLGLGLMVQERGLVVLVEVDLLVEVGLLVQVGVWVELRGLVFN